MATFTVDRRTWYRGKGNDESRLLRPDGQRCCIGFVGQQCGASDEYLLNRATAFMAGQEVNRSYENTWPTWMLGVGGDILVAYTTNDRRDISDEVRETKLKEIFARHGDEIVFVN